MRTRTTWRCRWRPARAARGVRIVQGAPVTGIQRDAGRVTGVVTERGTIEAEYVVNCAGMWARQVGALAGVSVPLQAIEHAYLITEPFDGVSPDLPIFEDPDRFAYYREETGGLMVGLFEPVAAPWSTERIPDDFSFGEIPSNWDRLAPFLEYAMEILPGLADVGVRKLFTGPESFSPDNGFLMGEAPEVDGFFVAAGFNSLGILTGGGAGSIMASWIVDGEPPVDVTGVDIARLQRWQTNRSYLTERSVELLGRLHSTGSWPYSQPSTGAWRPSVTAPRPTGDGGCPVRGVVGLGDAWYFVPIDAEIEFRYTYGRPDWFQYHAAEHRAGTRGGGPVRHVGDVEVPGAGTRRRVGTEPVVGQRRRRAGGSLRVHAVDERARRSDGRRDDHPPGRRPVPGGRGRGIPPPGRIDAGSLHRRRHRVPTSPTSRRAGHCSACKVPSRRDLLAELTTADLSNAAFPYLTAQEIDLHHARALAVRMSFVGELGWELFVPTEFSVGVYDRLVEVGAAHGLAHAGMATLESTRTEAGRLDYGLDMENSDSPLEAGLKFAVDFDKPDGFVGRDALLAQYERRPYRNRLVQFLLDDPEPLLHGEEPILLDGDPVGYVRSGAYGHTLGGAMGFGYVEHADGVTGDLVRGGNFEIVVAGEPFAGAGLAAVDVRPDE